MSTDDTVSKIKKGRGGRREGSGRKRLDADVMPSKESLTSKAYSVRLPSYVEGIALNIGSRTGEKSAVVVNRLLKTLLEDFLASPAGQDFVKTSGWADDVHRAALVSALREKQKARTAKNENVYEIRLKRLG